MPRVPRVGLGPPSASDWFSMAGYAFPFFYKKPFEILDIAVNGLINILEFCRKKRVKNF